ncbi:MAG: alkaline phosphatase family protein [Myxococcales bacterium]
MLPILGLLLAAPVQTVFVILLENADWRDVRGSSQAPYLNGALLPMAAHAEKYFNPPGVHPSEPNYLWLEAGTDFGVHDDAEPSAHPIKSGQHLVALLGKAGISWKAYQEGIAPGECPVKSHGWYAAKHDPFVFFADVTRSKPFCAEHIRPLAELTADLEQGKAARYNFITPDLCNDMHGARGCRRHLLRNGDDWMAKSVPRILASRQYRAGGAIFITWDEGEAGDGPIGMLVISPFAKAGFSSDEHYTHSSFLRTVEEIFGVTPLLGDAAKAKDLSELFKEFP